MVHFCSKVKNSSRRFQLIGVATFLKTLSSGMLKNVENLFSSIIFSKIEPVFEETPLKTKT